MYLAYEYKEVTGQIDSSDPLLKDIIEAIKWKYVSTNALFCLANNHKKLVANPVFKKAFTEEINLRFDNSNAIIRKVESSNDKPRYSYKCMVKKDNGDPFIPNLITALLG